MVYNTIHMIQVIQINRANNKGNNRGEGRKKEETQWMETGQKSSIFRLTFKESFRHGDGKKNSNTDWGNTW